MEKPETFEFIDKAEGDEVKKGAAGEGEPGEFDMWCIVSNHIIHGDAELRWCFREKPASDLDSGWRFLSGIDTEAYINDPSNMSVCAWQTMVEIEPAVLPLLHMRVGTDLVFEHAGKKRRFIFAGSEEEVDFEKGDCRK